MLMYCSLGSHPGTLMFSSLRSHPGTLMQLIAACEGSHSGRLMYSSLRSHSGTLMYCSEEPFWHANVKKSLWSLSV